MTRDFVEYNGKSYPVVTLPFNLINGDAKRQGLDYEVTIADGDLWYAIKDDYENEDFQAIGIDNTIYYYCDCGFLSCNPSQEKIINYFKEIKMI